MIKKILVFFLILLITIYFANGTTYINFDPHPQCSQNGGPGVGYSWIVGKCLNFQDGSYLIEIDSNEQNSATFYFYDDTNSKCQKGQHNVSKSYHTNNCYLAEWYIDGAFYNVNNYGVMSIVEDPGYLEPEGYRYTLYQPGDNQCQADYLWYQYYTQDMKFHNTMQTFLYECIDNVPFEVLCTQNLPCINSSIEFTCQSSQSSDYLHSISC